MFRRYAIVDSRDRAAGVALLAAASAGEFGEDQGAQLMLLRANCNGGHRIRTCKGFHPPVFKTGALPFGQPSQVKQI